MWIHNTDLVPITPEDCKDVPQKGKGKALIEAYGVAAAGHDLQHFKKTLDEHYNAMQLEIDAREAKEAEKAAKAEQKKRKSEVKADTEDVDMEDVDADAKPKKSSKKRKKEAGEEDDEDEKVSLTHCCSSSKADSDCSLQRLPRPPKSS